MTELSSPHVPSGKQALDAQSLCARQLLHVNDTGSQFGALGSRVQSPFVRHSTQMCALGSQSGSARSVQSGFVVHIIGGTTIASVGAQFARSSGFFSQYSELRFSHPARTQ